MNNSMNYTTLESVPANMSTDRFKTPICSEPSRTSIKERTCELHDIVFGINRDAKAIRADLFGGNEAVNKQERPPITCYEEALKQILDVAAETRAVLVDILQGIGVE